MSVIGCDLVEPVKNDTITVTFPSAPSKVIALLENESNAYTRLIKQGDSNVTVGWHSGTSTYSNVSLSGNVMTVVGTSRVVDFIYIAFA